MFVCWICWMPVQYRHSTAYRTLKCWFNGLEGDIRRNRFSARREKRGATCQEKRPPGGAGRRPGGVDIFQTSMEFPWFYDML